MSQRNKQEGEKKKYNHKSNIFKYSPRTTLKEGATNTFVVEVRQSSQQEQTTAAFYTSGTQTERRRHQR